MDCENTGLKAGIEIHQQLNTKEKLFCHCPTSLRDVADHSGKFFRYLRATESEMGEIATGGKRRDEEEPKFLLLYVRHHVPCRERRRTTAPLNAEALSVCLTIAKLFGMTPIPQVHTMRKLVIDGSNTSGFQRAASCCD